MNLRFYFLAIAFLFSQTAQSFSFLPKPGDPPPPTPKESAATQYYSSYKAMIITSWATTGLGVFLVPKTTDEKKELELREVRSGLQYTYVVGGAFWLGEGFMLVASESVRPTSNENIDEAELTTADVSPHLLRSMRSAFYGLHFFNVLWNTAMALNIENKDKWYYVSGVAVAPFLTDLINRSFFNRHKLSPYAPIHITAGYHPNGTPIALIGYSF